ncbi:MAG TPA: DUF721 domain-containing protein [Nitrospinota bacterium]|nr:DUF721 domain-containing protein [Nitrospinota bacterium]
MKNFVKIGTVLKKSLKKFRLEKGIKQCRILDIWDKVVGEQIAAVTRPGYIKGKTLYIFVRDSIWLQELKFLERMIIEKLNNKVGGKIIENIYFKIDTER